MKKPKLIILGTGFAALSILRKINIKQYDITVVSPRNHFLFTPLLPSTTVGTVEFRSIIEPIRVVRPRVEFYQASATSLHSESKEIICESTADGRSFTISYDYLVIAVGADSNTFNIPGVREYALFLKELGDARKIRSRIIQNLEQANTPGLPNDERSRLLHFVVVGGGPTGVEFAAEMHDFVTDDLVKSYPSLVADVRITLLEATNKILNTFDVKLGEYALQIFRRQQIEVRIESIVTRVEPNDIILRDGSRLPYGLVVWSTGNTQTQFIASQQFPKSQSGRILTDRYLKVSRLSDVFAIGDCATVEGEEFPATAQVAMQAGKYLGRYFNILAADKKPDLFKYKHLGMLAYIGSNRALADLPRIKGKGFSTWLFWRSAYLTRLVSLKNKILVLFDWTKTFIFGRDVSNF